MHQGLMVNLRAIRHHDVLASRNDLVKDRYVVWKYRQLRTLKMGTCESLIAAARIDDHTHIRLVNGRDRGKAHPVCASDDRAFSVYQDRGGKVGNLFSLRKNRYSTHGDIEFICGKITG